MQKSVKQLKTLLILLSVSILSACPGLQDFPDWSPVLIIPSKNKYFECALIDKDKFIFQCSKESKPYSEKSFDGYVCNTMKETQEIIAWGIEAKEYAENNCKAK